MEDEEKLKDSKTDKQTDRQTKTEIVNSPALLCDKKL